MSSENLKNDTQKRRPLRRPLHKKDDGWFSWVLPALQSRRMLKTWLRCCVALCVTLILMVVPGPSLTMGQASFFAAILATMLPPNFAFSIFFMAMTTLFLGILIGWAWGAAAIAAAHAVRSTSLLAQQRQKFQASIDPNVSVTLQTQLATFHGLFLDVRSSAVHGVFVFVGSYALAAVRAFVPNLALLSIFGTVVIDVIGTAGPLIPTTEYMIPKPFILPACFYAAVALASIVFIFPESLSHVWLTMLLDDFWTPTLDLFRLQSEALTAAPSDRDKWEEMNTRGTELRGKMLEGLEVLNQKVGLIDLDCSLGRLGPADLKKISAELKSMMFRAGAMHSFQMFVNDANEFAQDERILEEKAQRGDATPNRYHVLHRKIRDREAQHGHGLDALVPILASSSAELRAACESGLLCIMDFLKEANTRRWSSFVFRATPEQVEDRHRKLGKTLKTLENAWDDFKSVQRVNLVKPFEAFFDPQTRQLKDNSDTFATKSLFICFVFIDTLDSFSERLIKMLKTLQEIDAQRPQQSSGSPAGSPASKRISRQDTLQAPLGYRWAPLQTRRHSILRGKTLHRRSDATQTPSHPQQHSGASSFLSKFFRFLKSPEGIFSLRVAVVSFALWIPSVIPSSAWFYYEQKGMWAFVMAQTALALYAGDQIMSFLIRIIGTVVGLLLGIAVWHIGAGHGNGNPYGIVIASVNILGAYTFSSLLIPFSDNLPAPFVFARIAGPQSQIPIWTMIPTTILFVTNWPLLATRHSATFLSQHWLQLALRKASNPRSRWIQLDQCKSPQSHRSRVGIHLGWKRALLVVVRFTAAFIMMVFPNPMSSRVLVRKTLAATIGETGNILAGEIEAFLAEEAKARCGQYDTVPVSNDAVVDEDKVSPKEKRIRKIGKRVLAVAMRLKELYESFTFARFEPQLAGTWPHDEYHELFNQQARLIGGLTPFMNPNFLSDIFTTLSILSNSLKDGHPLPAYLPTLRDRLIYHEYHPRGHHSSLYSRIVQKARPVAAQKLNLDLKLGEKPNSSGRDLHIPGSFSEADSYTEVEMRKAASPAKVDGSSMGLDMEELTLDVLMDEQLPAHSTAVVAFSSLITRIDEMTEIQYYLDREERAIGGGFSESP
ncbi:unnamed protein product [Cyclocybe aegerita]|uniref:ER transporter 6TM N-terminal domain-containing protein n=1 Tax=Cyclocybe aegerita TaxID=1973307 RepID=A0A8S0X3W4_CYCAE|nr:unnamed protein product [Cyclocybe aegerita]